MAISLFVLQSLLRYLRGKKLGPHIPMAGLDYGHQPTGSCGPRYRITLPKQQHLIPRDTHLTQPSRGDST